MIDFVNKYGAGSNGVGTPINRKNMMGVQGFENKNIEFEENGSIREQGEGGLLTTTFNGTQITEKFEGNSGNIIIKIITFKSDGTIEEVITGQ